MRSAASVCRLGDCLRMKKPNRTVFAVFGAYMFLVAAAVVMMAAIVVRAHWRRTRTHSESQASVTLPAATVSSNSTSGELSAEVPSLRNAAPPEFDEAIDVPKSHRAFHLAKGEENIVAQPGSIVHLHVQCNLQKGWYTYPAESQGKYIPRNRVSLADSKRATIDGEVTSIPPAPVDPRASEMWAVDFRRFSTGFYYDIPIRIAANASAGKTDLQLEIDSMAVSDFQ